MVLFPLFVCLSHSSFVDHSLSIFLHFASFLIAPSSSSSSSSFSFIYVLHSSPAFFLPKFLFPFLSTILISLFHLPFSNYASYFALLPFLLCPSLVTMSSPSIHHSLLTVYLCFFIESLYSII